MFPFETRILEDDERLDWLMKMVTSQKILFIEELVLEEHSLKKLKDDIREKHQMVYDDKPVHTAAIIRGFQEIVIIIINCPIKKKKILVDVVFMTIFELQKRS